MIDEAAPVVVDTPAPDAAPAAEPTPAAEPQTAEQRQDAAVEAFKKAVDEVSDKPDAEPASTPAAVDPKAAAEPAKADAQPPVVADPVAAEQKAAVDAEISKINADLKAGGHKTLSKAAEERFRDLAMRPTREAVEKEYAPIRQQAERMKMWDDIVVDAQASGEQLGQAVQYIKAFNSGDPVLMNTAYEMLSQELAGMAKALGREMPGVVDPLAEHADLRDAVEAGTLDRKLALAVAKDRATLARTGEHSQRVSEEQQFQRHVDTARADIDTLNAQLKTNDPQFLQKLQYLMPTLNVIKQTMHPSKWVGAIKDAYLAIPAIPQAAAPVAAAPAKPPVSGVPTRPTGGNGTMRPAIPKDPVAAFKFGLESLNR